MASCHHTGMSLLTLSPLIRLVSHIEFLEIFAWESLSYVLYNFFFYACSFVCCWVSVRWVRVLYSFGATKYFRFRHVMWQFIYCCCGFFFCISFYSSHKLFVVSWYFWRVSSICFGDFLYFLYFISLCSLVCWPLPLNLHFFFAISDQYKIAQLIGNPWRQRRFDVWGKFNDGLICIFNMSLCGFISGVWWFFSFTFLKVKYL